MSQSKDATPEERLGWLMGFRAGISGTPFPAAQQVGGSSIAPVPGVSCPDRVLATESLMQMPTPHSVVRPIGRFPRDLVAAVAKSPPPTSFPWYELGGRLRSWFGAWGDTESPSCGTTLHSGEPQSP